MYKNYIPVREGVLKHSSKHSLYFRLLKLIDDRKIYKYVRFETNEAIKDCFTNLSQSHADIIQRIKICGLWLGRITFGDNKPLIYKAYLIGINFRISILKLL
ncbi:hypothetical protein HZS_3650 [Henneguya salminicola]|nr:hypothetical protein HZS_3650 [Henneguya salminicola]